MLLLHPPVEPWLVPTPEGCLVRLLTCGPGIDAVYLRALPDNEETLLPMQPVTAPLPGTAAHWRAWQAQLPWDGANPATRYAFKVLAGARQHWLAADGAHAHVPPQDRHFRVLRQPPPAWVREQVFYQVFPDRFAIGRNAPASRDGQTVYGGRALQARQLAWGAPLDAGHPGHVFYGGDLDGLRQRLDHVQHAVGATAVYLNPVFTSGSNHRYDTEDYDQVDPHLGGNQALQRLAEAMRARGLRLMLDAVVNHTGTNHPWFNRWAVHAGTGAAQAPDSPWRGWYAFTPEGQPVYWKGHDSLPVLDFAHPGVQAAIYAGADAVLRRWLRPPYAIDGWRLDVVHMLGEGPGAANNEHHVREIRRAVKQENPQAYVLGEHFSEATRWLQGDQEDGAMNYYGFAQPVWAWLAGEDVNGHAIELDTPQFAQWLQAARAVIAHETQLVQFNLLGSHDTPRLLTRLRGDRNRARMALRMLFAYPGVPCLYYGDEVGMEGGPDPDCRRCMDWSGASWQRDLLAEVRALADWRRARAEWRHGAMQLLAWGEDWLAWARHDARAMTLVLANRGPGVCVPLPLHALPWTPSHWRAHDAQLRAATAQELVLELPAATTALLFGDA